MFLEASRSPVIDCRPKRFVLAPTYEDHTRKIRTSPYAEDLANLRRRITKGIGIEPRYYRQNIDTTSDPLLDVLGIKHLHLGGQNSDVLIYLVEYDDYVAVLEINDHKHFRSDPIGVLLHAHKAALGHLLAAQAGVSEQNKEYTNALNQRTRSLEAARVRAREAAEIRKRLSTKGEPPPE